MHRSASEAAASARAISTRSFAACGSRSIYDTRKPDDDHVGRAGVRGQSRDLLHAALRRLYWIAGQCRAASRARPRIGVLGRIRSGRAAASISGCSRPSCCSSRSASSAAACSAISRRARWARSGRSISCCSTASPGLWFGYAFIAIGLAITALTLVGYFFIGAAFPLWMAFVNGGGLILGGLWMRRD